MNVDRGLNRAVDTTYNWREKRVSSARPAPPLGSGSSSPPLLGAHYANQHKHDTTQHWHIPNIPTRTCYIVVVLPCTTCAIKTQRAAASYPIRSTASQPAGFCTSSTCYIRSDRGSGARIPILQYQLLPSRETSILGFVRHVDRAPHGSCFCFLFFSMEASTIASDSNAGFRQAVVLAIPHTLPAQFSVSICKDVSTTG